jgi:hypothetical protein
MTSTVKQKNMKPSTLRAYHRIEAHHTHVKSHVCDGCYARGDSLIIQGNVAAHLSDICASVKPLSLDFVNELEDYEFIACINIREDIYELKLLQSKKEAVA